ncbi:2-amino-4-hydroxy-6-hydroxymethyldihydropteridine diphosphokinase [Sulfitobacter sp. LCG007]
MAGKFLPEFQRNCLVAGGANLTSSFGGPAATLRNAFQLMGENVGVIRATSRFYRTPAYPAGAGPDYVNAATWLVTDRQPLEILDMLHAIEAEAGRVRTRRWAARGLDLDLLAIDDLVLPDTDGYRAWADLAPQEQMREAPSELILPHPRIQDRAFVLVPLADIAPDWRHPVLDRTVREMLDGQPEAALGEIVALQ